MAEAQALGSDAAESERRVIEDVQELELQRAAKPFGDGQALVQRCVLIEPVRAIDIRIGAEDTGSGVRHVVSGADSAVGREQARADGLHPGVAGAVHADGFLNGVRGNAGSKLHAAVVLIEGGITTRDLARRSALEYHDGADGPAAEDFIADLAVA